MNCVECCERLEDLRRAVRSVLAECGADGGVLRRGHDGRVVDAGDLAAFDDSCCCVSHSFDYVIAAVRALALDDGEHQCQRQAVLHDRDFHRGFLSAPERS